MNKTDGKDADKEVPSYRFVCSVRSNLALLILVGTTASYMMRTNLSFAIVCMVRTETSAVNGTTQAPATTTASAAWAPTFDWSSLWQGNLLGSFFWGYICTQIAGGWIATRYGSHLVVTISIALAVLATLLSPVAAEVSYAFLFVLRVVLGFCQGITFPAFMSMWSKWAPPMERSKLISISFAGNQVGNIVTMALAGQLCLYGFAGGWPSIFYVTGIFSFAWLVVWVFIGSNTPSSNRLISSQEKAYIMDKLKSAVNTDESKKIPVPWLKCFTSVPIWAAFIGHFAGDWAAYAVFTCLPLYMDEVLHMDVGALGLLLTIPYAAYFLFINIGGFVADYVRDRNLLSTKNIRKVMTFLAYIPQAAFLLAAGYCTVGQEELIVTFISLGVGISGLNYSGCVLSYMDIAPEFSGTLFGIGNTISSLAGILAPIVMGAMTSNKEASEWLAFFYLTAGMLVVCCLVFCIFGQGEVLPWAAKIVADHTVAADDMAGSVDSWTNCFTLSDSRLELKTEQANVYMVDGGKVVKTATRDSKRNLSKVFPIDHKRGLTKTIDYSDGKTSQKRKTATDSHAGSKSGDESKTKVSDVYAGIGCAESCGQSDKCSTDGSDCCESDDIKDHEVVEVLNNLKQLIEGECTIHGYCKDECHENSACADDGKQLTQPTPLTVTTITL